MGFSKKIRPSDHQTCNVILDYGARKVVKCIIEGKLVPTDFERMNEYYKQVYPQMIEQVEKLQDKK